MFGVLFGITAGIMTEVAIKSLLLEAARYDPEDRVVSKVCFSSGIFESGRYSFKLSLPIFEQFSANFEPLSAILNDRRPISSDRRLF